MARTISAIPEMYSGTTTDLGAGAYDVTFCMRVLFDGGDPDGEWHDYGIPTVDLPKGALDALNAEELVEHGPQRVPFVITQMSTGLDLLQDISIQAARDGLEA